MLKVYEQQLGAWAIIMLENKLSKVTSKRNYIVHTYDNTVRILPFGEANRRGLMSWRLTDISKHGIMSIPFSKRADAEEMLTKLVEAGYNFIEKR